MLNYNLREKVAKVVGLQTLNTGSRGDGLVVLSLWCSCIIHFQGTRILVVGIVNTNKWRRGIILTQSDEAQLREEEGGFIPNPPNYIGDKYIELDKNWDDPVAKALHSVDIFHRNDRVYQGSATYLYELFIDTQTTQTEFKSRFNENPQLMKLWGSLLEAVRYLVDLYNDDEMRKFISRS